jgi:hypothetical protein
MKNFLLFILFATLGIFTASGHLQEVIHFADPLNELAFFVTTLTLALLLLIASIPDKEQRRRFFGKIHRILNIMGDRSEQFEDNPNYRFVIIQKIWREQ